MTNYGMGWLPDIPDHRDFLLSSFELPLKTLPTKIIGLSRNIPIYDQGSLGSCTANAVGRLFHYVDNKQGGIDLDPSRLQIYYDSRKMHGWESWDSGAFLRDAITVVREIGAAPENLWPYDTNKFTQAPPQTAYTEALNHQAIAYMRVTQSLDAMKNCIAAGYPFVIGATLYENFLTTGADGMVSMPSGSVAGGHAFLVDGYDDATGRFECPNSWTETWGWQGRFFIPYTYLVNNDLADDLWTIRSVEEGQVPPPPPPPNFVGFDATVVKAGSTKVVVHPNQPLLTNIAGRQIRAKFDGGEFTGKVKVMEEDRVVLKPTSFDLTWDIVGDPIRVETI